MIDSKRMLSSSTVADHQAMEQRGHIQSGAARPRQELGMWRSTKFMLALRRFMLQRSESLGCCTPLSMFAAHAAKAAPWAASSTLAAQTAKHANVEQTYRAN